MNALLNTSTSAVGPQPFDLNRSTSTVRPQPFDLNRSTSTVRPVFLSYFIFHTSYFILRISNGISTKTLWADVFSRINLSKVAKKPPDTEGSSFLVPFLIQT
jgi:hypothetical protein